MSDSGISGFNNNGLLDGFNRTSQLTGLNNNSVLSTNSSSQTETKHYYPQIISMLKQRYSGKLTPGGAAERALNLQISQMQKNWEGQNHTSYMNDFGVQTMINQIDNYVSIDQMRSGATQT